MFSVFQIKNLQKNFSLWLYSLFVFSFLSLPLHAETNASVAAGENHSLLLRTDGSLWSMGKNDRGQRGDGSELERGLVGWWKFDGDATDSSGNGNDGAVNGATLTTDRHGQANSAYSFDGVNDYIETPSVNWGLDNTLSVSVWIKNEVNSALVAPLSLGRPPLSDEILLGFRDNNSIEFYSHKSTQNWARKEFSLGTQTWVNLVGVYNGGFSSEEILIYLNGEVQSSQYVTDGVPSLLSDTSPRMLRIGARVESSPARFFNGSIDDVRIYNRALLTSEVSALYTLESQPFSHQPARVVDENVTAIASGSENSYFIKKDGSLWGMGRNDRGQLGNAQGLDQGLVGWWKFDGDATDSSGNGNDGTVNGAALTTDRHGQANRAYSFDGVDDWILLGDSLLPSDGSNWAVSMWVLSPQTNDTHGILLSQYLAAPAVGRMNFYADGSDNLAFFSSSMGQPNPSFSLIDHSSWSHITMNSKNNKASIFENMVIRLEDLSIDPILSTQTRIGNDTIPTRWLKGSVDDIRIYNRALSAAEISALYTLESQPEDPSAPIQIVDSNVTAVSSHGSHALFQKTDGSLWAMGANEYGQLGDGTTTDRHTPRQVFAWEEKASNSLARSAFDGVEALDGKLYFAGGYSGPASSVFESFDPSTQSWQTLPSLTTARIGISMAAYNGKLYVFGGSTAVGSGNKLDSMEIYDSATKIWSIETNLPVPHNYSVAVTYGDKILLFGGWDQAEDNMDQVLEFDPSLNTWSAKTTMPVGRSGMKAVVCGGKVWLMGGVTGSGNDYSNRVDIYDPVTDTWAQMPDLTVARLWALAWTLNGQVYIGGGRPDASTYLTTIESYDFSSNQWRIIGNLPARAYQSDSALINGKLYITGGYDGSAHSNKLYMTDLNPVTAFSAGGDHSRFVQGDGSLWAMGRNHVGQLGDSTTTDRTSPVKVVNSGVEEVASGQSHGYYLKGSGDLWSMGLNADGQLGDGTTTNRNSPVQVLNGSNVSQVSAGSKESYFTKIDGTTWSMGRNDYGQLGNGSTTDVSTPARLFTWKQNQSISLPRKVYSGAELLNGKIYLAGGFDGNSSADFERYDPILNQWSSLPSLPEGLIGSMTGTLDSKIYSIGGATQILNQGDGNLSGESFYLYAIDGISDELLVIDPDDGNFSIVGDLGVDFNSLSTIDYNQVDGKLYANAGYDLYLIDVSNGVATKVSTMPRASGAPLISFLNDGRLFVHYEIGGETHGTGYYYNDVNFTGEVRVGEHSSFRNIFATELDENGKIWSANQETAKLGRSNGTNYASEWVGSGTVQQVPLDLDIDSDSVIRLVSGLFPWSGSDSAVAKLSELNSITGSSDKTFIFSRAHIGSLASTPLSAVSKRQVPQSTVRIYDPVSNQWGDGPDLPSPIHRGSVVSLSDRILILGGLDGENNRTGDVYELLSGSSSWMTKASMPTSRSVTASAVLDGKVWVVGGIDFSWSDKVEIFDPSTNSWTSGPSLNSPRVSPVAWVSSGILHVAGGFDGITYLDSIETYDPSSNSWLIAGTLPESIFQSDAVVVNDEVFFVGGKKESFVNPSGMTTLNVSPLTLGTGDSHTVLVKQDGTFWGMGRNDSGQIGDGSLTNRSYPVPIISSYTLVVNGAAEGNATGGGEWSIGTPVTLTATPNPGYLFAGWTGDLNSTDANVTITPSANMEVNATFAQDLNDNDDDNLTNFYEIVTLGTNADNNDTDGDGLPDGVEDGVLGIDPLLDNALIVALFAQREIDAHEVGLAEGNTSGQQYVYDYRSTFSLYNEAEVNASAQQKESNGSLTGEPLGRLYVQTNPAEFDLYTEADLNASMDSERVRGIADGNLSGTSQVVANPAAYGLYSEAEVNASLLSEYNRGVSEGNASGWSYLQSNRLAYSLFNSSDLNTSGDLAYAQGVDEGNTSGIAYAVAHPSEFSLHTSADLNESGVLFRANGVQDGNASGQSHVLNNLSSFQLFTESELNDTRLVELELGRAEGNQSGMSYVLANPHEFNLFESIDLNRSGDTEYLRGQPDGDLLGRSYVQANPNLYQLFTQSDLNVTATLSHQSGRGEGNASGITYLQTHARDYGLYTRTDRELLIAQARSEGLAEGNASGIAQVQASPANYSLLSLSEAEQVRQSTRQLALSDGFQMGVDWVRNNPRLYNLFDSAQRTVLMEQAKSEGHSEGLLAGEAYVLARPGEFGWLDDPTRSALEESARLAAYYQGLENGKVLVLNDPAGYSLFTTTERDAIVQSTYTSSFMEGNTTGIATVFANRLSLGLSADHERDERIRLSGELGYSVGNAAGRAEALATAQADLSAQGLHLVEYLEQTELTPYTYNWFYQPGAGWLWTDKSTFPYLYLSTGEEGYQTPSGGYTTPSGGNTSPGGTQSRWLYYDANRTDFPFYDYEKKTWKEIEP